jgi:peptide/nickel transport system ATP-binding protein
VSAVAGIAATETPLAELDRLEVRFGGDLQAVAGVSLALAPGTTFGLVGESGCGKTTLAKAVVGLRRPSGGTVRIEGRDIHALRRSQKLWLSRRVQMIFQDPVSSLSPRFTVRRLLAEPLRIHRLSIAEHWPAVLEVTRVLGLADSLLDSYPHQISGGQARRVAIARALVLRPRLVVADEPTAGLDVSIQGDLLNLLRDVQRLYRLGFLMVSHNLSVIRRVTDRVGIMYLGKLVETGPTARLFRAPAHPYTQALISANPTIDPIRRQAKIVLAGEVPSPRRPPSGCRFHTRCPRAQERCRIEEPLLAERSPGHEAACHYPVN